MPAVMYIGDAIETMNKLPAGSVDLILTSPPFLALRSYLPGDHPDKGKEGGSQATPGEFIDWLIDVAEACDRVLAPHGSMCIELGDTYSGSGGAGGDYAEDGLREGQPTFRQTKGGNWPLAKSLSLIPELFRLSLVYGFNPLTGRQTERWRLRNVIRWVRPNPPVGALGDKFRPATSELMVFCKSAKRYFDLDAVREPVKHPLKSATTAFDEDGNRRRKLNPYDSETQSAGAPPLDWWNIPLLEGEEETRYGPGEKRKAHAKPGDSNNMVKAAGVGAGRTEADAERWASNLAVRTEHPLGSPPLDWWEIPPGGFPGQHYAVFPLELCVKPVKAMCPARVCNVCGEPSRRIVGDAEYVRTADGRLTNGDEAWRRGLNPAEGQNTNESMTRVAPTTGWTDCGHDDWRPGLVGDPFVGSGTVLSVATGHGRDAWGIDLDSRNFDLALGRVGPFMLTLGNIDE